MRDLPLIYGQRIVLRPFAPGDAADYSAWLQDETLRRMVGESRLTPSEVVEKQEVWTRDDKMVEYIIADKTSGRPIGDISVKLEDGKAKFGLMIGDQRYRDGGYGTEAAECLMSYAKGVLGTQELYAEIFPFNTKSISFHEKLKFSKWGTSVDDKHRDCIVYYRNL
ncbi:MAG: GNAT family N-acetyltransferase [Thermodesulfobacteriota bacterium]|jgi:RimJ/RimL family protein N-acetyltransferase